MGRPYARVRQTGRGAVRVVQCLALRLARRGPPAAACLQPVPERSGGAAPHGWRASLAALSAPVGWLVTGFAGAGDERTGTRASAVALTGPNPLGGPAEMLVVAEEPGVGLGAGLAGLDGVDPGAGFASAPPAATVSFGKHGFPLWQVDSPGRAAFAGEIKGHWMWVVLWPETAGCPAAGADQAP